MLLNSDAQVPGIEGLDWLSHAPKPSGAWDTKGSCYKQLHLLLLWVVAPLVWHLAREIRHITLKMKQMVSVNLNLPACVISLWLSVRLYSNRKTDI